MFKTGKNTCIKQENNTKILLFYNIYTKITTILYFSILNCVTRFKTVNNENRSFTVNIQISQKGPKTGLSKPVQNPILDPQKGPKMAIWTSKMGDIYTKTTPFKTPKQAIYGQYHQITTKIQ